MGPPPVPAKAKARAEKRKAEAPLEDPLPGKDSRRGANGEDRSLPGPQKVA